MDAVGMLKELVDFDPDFSDANREPNQWELDFIEDMRKREESGKRLTNPMCVKINEIHRSVFG